MLKSMQRIHGLDALRGLAAFSIMIYHYLNQTALENGTILPRIGYYCVSIFYILSGLTLYSVYYHVMQPNKKDLIDFFVKRFFRIYPLLILITLLTIIVFNSFSGILNLILNITGLFGFIAWDQYIATGAWSIGNELVFYVMFPFFVIAAKKSKWVTWLIFVALFAVYCWFAFIRMPGTSQAVAWANYVNPLNQAFLFYCGFMMGLLFENTKIKQSVNALISAGVILLFIFYPTSGNPGNIVIGFNRIIFSALCIMICFCFYKTSVRFPKPLIILGQASYSLYLFHPIVWKVMKNMDLHLPAFISIPVCSLISVLISYFVYLYFEKYFILQGKSFLIKRLSITG